MREKRRILLPMCRLIDINKYETKRYHWLMITCADRETLKSRDRFFFHSAKTLIVLRFAPDNNDVLSN